MRKRLELVLVAGAALIALAFAGPALGAYSPQLFTVSWQGSITTVGFVQEQTDDAGAALIFYAPPGMRANFSASAGKSIGEAVALLDIAGAQGLALGDVVVANPADPAIAPLTKACTGTTTHTAVWVLRLTINDVPIDVPVSVDQTTGQEAAFSSYKLRICFRSPYIPPAQGGQPNGAKPYRAELTVEGVFTPPSASNLPWTGLFVPWKVGTGSLNPVASAESQSVVSYPVTFRITGKDVVTHRVVGRGRHRRVVTVHKARIVGKLAANGDAQAGADYAIVVDRKKVAKGTTNASGTFTRLIPLRRTTSFRATADLTWQDTNASCNPVLPISTNPLILPTCTGVTAAGIAADSNTITVKKKPTRKRR
jgi:hypothetical protein